MVHNLMNDRMAFVGSPPWHRLGQQVEKRVTSDEMLKAAGLDWQVHKRPAIGARIIKERGSNPPIYDRYFLQRDPIEHETDGPVLGVVSHGYEVLQNNEAFGFFEPLISSETCHYEAAGALGNGERVWVQVRVDGLIEVSATDTVGKFFLLSNSHDGRGSVSLRFTPIRVVCQNTLNLAMKGGEDLVKIRHSRNMRDRLSNEQVATLLKVISETFSAAEKQFRKLAATKTTPEIRERLLGDLFPPSEKQKQSGELPLRWSMIDVALSDNRVSPKDTRDSLWGLYNAITRTEDYRQPAQERGPEERLNRVWFGSSADIKVKALQRAVELCE
jgi:phage/plasmid-like protein (TIGR03299 family)